MKSFVMGDMTVKEFADFLSVLKNQDYYISICGMTSVFWMNVDEENHCIIFDTDNLNEG